MTVDPGPNPDPRDAPATTNLGLRLLAVVRDVLQPITALTTPERVDEALRLLGWDPQAVAVSQPLADAVRALGESLAPIESALDLQRSPAFLEVVATLPEAGASVADIVALLRDWTPPGGAPAGAIDDLVADLLDGVPLNALIVRFPLPFLVLALVGAIRDDQVAGITMSDGSVLRRPGTRPHVDLAAFAEALSDPLGALRRSLLFDAAGTRRPAAAVLAAAARATADPLMTAGASVRYPLPAAEIPTNLAGLADADSLVAVTLSFTAAGTQLPGRLRLVLGLTEDTGGQGLGAVVAADGGLSVSTRTAAGSFSASMVIGAAPLRVTSSGIRPAGGGAAPTIDVSATYATGETLPLMRLGAADGTRFEIDRVSVTLGVDVEDDRPDFSVAAVLAGTRLVVQAAADDGFLSAVLGTRPLESVVDLAVDWSMTRGLRVRGGAGFSLELPIDQALGPVTIDSAWLALQVALDETPALRTEVALSMSFALGPFSAAVQRMGIAAVVTFPPERGNLGPADLELRGKPPSGAGLAIRTPAICGGGFLSMEDGRYSGVFELTLVGTVSVKVIGIITTRLPDGSPGFALLLMITADGFTPIQLGMGFVLTGIGGLIALNRTVDVDAVRGGLSSGVLDSVLFAKDPVANANRILATLETIFPLAPDRLLIGPLAEIGWGSPPVVKVRLALLLEIPSPLRVVLLAALALVLPDADAPVVELHVDAIGVLDLSRGELALDASLHHSRLWKFTLTGDLALRLNWGDDPMFVLSVGGFHPAFAPPAGLRRLERLTLSLSDSENPVIRFQTYLAVTANTIQLGARVQVRAEAGGFGVDGGGAFDALVQWVPLGLDVRFEAWIRIFSPAGTLCGARLALQVTGPQPWHVVGVVNVQVLAFTIEAGVDFVVGDPLPPTPVESVDVIDLLWQELSRPGSWATALPSGRTPGATLGGLPAGDPAAAQPMLVHPLGTISVRQKVVPLGTTVTRVGAMRPKAGARRYDLDVASPTGIGAAPLLDRFAPAQFTDQREDEKLSAPSFVSWPAGLSFAAAAADGLPVGRGVAADVAYEILDLTTFDLPAAPGGGSAPGVPEVLDLTAGGGPAGWAGLAVVPA